MVLLCPVTTCPVRLLGIPRFAGFRHTPSLPKGNGYAALPIGARLFGKCKKHSAIAFTFLAVIPNCYAIFARTCYEYGFGIYKAFMKPKK